MNDSNVDRDPYLFPQPVGLWKKRGASNLMIELAATEHVSPDSFQHANQADVQHDQMGFGIWHYWAQGTQPEKNWKHLRNMISSQWDMHCAVSGEHPLHRLILNNRNQGCQLWKKHASFPVDATTNEDTFWHCLAWAGNEELVDLLSDHFDIQQINNTDSYGMTAASIAVHRGGKNLLKQFLLLGADPDIPDEQNKVILHHVAQYGDVSWFSEIQDLGAADDVKNDRGQTPVDVLKERTKHGTQTDLDIIKIHWDRRYFQKRMF